MTQRSLKETLSLSHDDRPGCLPALLRRLLGKSNHIKKDRLPYFLRDKLLSPAERSFLGALQLAVKDQVAVCPKVRLGDVFFVTGTDKPLTHRNRINQKHVDFLLCDPKTYQPLAGIELDDSTHDREDRKERDELVDRVFESAGLPILHVRTQKSYDVTDLARSITSALSGKTQVAHTKTDDPICPKCKLPMLRRKARKGPHAGKDFWGCPNFPECRQTIR